MKQNTNEQQLTTQTAGQLSLTNLPDLDKLEAAPTELSGEYWTPLNEGETKRVFFAGLEETSVLEPETGETRNLLNVKFIEKQGSNYRTIRNASRRLVGVFEQFAAHVRPGDAFEITYLGKKKNTNNSFKSDNWSVRPLIVKSE